MEEFKTPDFLQNCDVDTIHKEMISMLPGDIDCSEGSHAWNLTRPTALEVAQMLEFYLPQVIRLFFPQWSTGIYLDYKAAERNIKRKVSTRASGTLTITGSEGTTISKGSIFATAAINDQPSINYETTEDAVIPDEGTIDVEAQCTETGVAGNTKAGTIVLKVSNISGVTGVTNSEDFSGGNEDESDESLRERILEYDRSSGSSYVGNKGDYRRWAKSVNGVGEAVVVSPEDKSGKVTIILTDQNGDPATQQLCEAVYNYIMRPDNEYERLAPPNAVLYCIAPETVSITISATIEMTGKESLSTIKKMFIEQTSLYLAQASSEKEVKYTKIGSILSSISGVNDYKNLTINGGTANVPVTVEQVAVVTDENVMFTEGDVV